MSASMYSLQAINTVLPGILNRYLTTNVTRTEFYQSASASAEITLEVYFSHRKHPMCIYIPNNLINYSVDNFIQFIIDERIRGINIDKCIEIMKEVYKC